MTYLYSNLFLDGTNKEQVKYPFLCQESGSDFGFQRLKSPATKTWSVGFAFNLNNTLKQGVSLCPIGHQIIEIKFIDEIPAIILSELSKFFVARTAISKYSAARLFSNEEISADKPYFAW